MKTLHGFPYFEIEFDTEGGLVKPAHASDAKVSSRRLRLESRT